MLGLKNICIYFTYCATLQVISTRWPLESIKHDLRYALTHLYYLAFMTQMYKACIHCIYTVNKPADAMEKCEFAII